jgi:hypothetical protein
MLTTLALTIALASTIPTVSADIPAPVLAAVQGSLALPNAHVEVVDVAGALAPDCKLGSAELPASIAASGRVPVHLVGAGASGIRCERWVWVRVRVSAPSLVTTRDVPEGAPLGGAVATAEREVLPGHQPLSKLPEGASAGRPLASGTPIEAAFVRVGPPPGDPVTILLRSGALAVEQRGRAMACRQGRVCALLPSGRRVEGDWHDGRIELDMP